MISNNNAKLNNKLDHNRFVTWTELKEVWCYKWLYLNQFFGIDKLIVLFLAQQLTLFLDPYRLQIPF